MTEKEVSLFNEKGLIHDESAPQVSCCNCEKELPKSHAFVFQAIEKKYICQDCYLQIG